MASKTISSRILPNDQVDLSKVEDVGAQVAEVVTSYAGSVLDVAHVGQSRSRRSSSVPLMAFGGVLMVGGLGLFGYEVAQPWEQYRSAAAEAQQLRREAPPAPGLGTGSLGMLIALLGLVPFVAGGMRRRDTGLDAYLIGEGNEANFKVRGADLPDPAATALVARTSEGYALAFTPSMQGRVDFGEQSVSLTDLVASGRARASDGAYRYMLPHGAKAKIMHGDTRFDVSLVNRGSVVAGRGEIDWPFWSYFGGTATVGTAFYLLMRSIPDDAFAMQISDVEASARFAAYFHQADEQMLEESVAVDVTPDHQQSNGQKPQTRDNGKRAPGSRGNTGNPEERSPSSASAPGSPRSAVRHFDRAWDPVDAAERAGILSVLGPQDRRLLAFGGAYTADNDDGHIWANTQGIEGSHGPGGLELGESTRVGGVGDGVRGMDGGVLGDGVGSGGFHPGTQVGKSGPGFGDRRPKLPTVRIETKDTVSGDISKDLIRRVVRGRLNEISSCYNEALTRNPNLEGRVTVQFAISGVGKVTSAIVQENATKDSDIAACITKAVRRWKFPRGDGGGVAVVSYPFMLTRG